MEAKKFSTGKCRFIVFNLMACFACLLLHGQSIDSLHNSLFKSGNTMSNRNLNAISDSYKQVNEGIEKQTISLLDRMQKKEGKLRKNFRELIVQKRENYLHR